MNKSA